MPEGYTVKIEGLKEFRKALRDASDANPRMLTTALKEAGSILPPKIRANAPKRTGQLAGSVGSPLASGTKGRIPVRAKHAPFLEFRTGGGWGASVNAKYGGPPRFGYKAVEDSSEQIIDRIFDGLESIVSASGWFK